MWVVPTVRVHEDAVIKHGVVKIAEVCIKIPYRGTEVSIAMDDSCGCMKVIGRCEIRVFIGDNKETDITRHIKLKKDSGIYPSTLDDLSWVKRRIDKAYKLGLIKEEE